MTYQEAHRIGSVVDGYIKCTYAKIYDPDGGLVFSLQHRDTSIVNEAREEYLKWIGASPITPEKDANVDVTAYVQDVPVCVSYNYTPDQRMVRVGLTDEAIKHIAVRFAPKRLAYVYLYYRNAYNQKKVYARVPEQYGTWELYNAFCEKFKGQIDAVMNFYGWSRTKAINHCMLASYDHKMEMELNPNSPFCVVRDKIIRELRSAPYFEVKHVAIDWIPANLDNTQVISPNGYVLEQLDQAKKKLNKAKALLAAASATIII